MPRDSLVLSAKGGAQPKGALARTKDVTTDKGTFTIGHGSVVIAATSEPASGSDSANAAMASPRATFGR